MSKAVDTLLSILTLDGWTEDVAQVGKPISHALRADGDGSDVLFVHGVQGQDGKVLAPARLCVGIGNAGV